MTDFNNERREPRNDELSINELGAVSGGDLLNHMIDKALLTVWVATEGAKPR